MITIVDVGVMCAVETLSIARVSRPTGLFSVDGLGMYLGEVGSQHIVTAVSVVFRHSFQLNDGNNTSVTLWPVSTKTFPFSLIRVITDSVYSLRNRGPLSTNETTSFSSIFITVPSPFASFLLSLSLTCRLYRSFFYIYVFSSSVLTPIILSQRKTHCITTSQNQRFSVTDTESLISFLSFFATTFLLCIDDTTCLKN
jgi:hypothetical protein